MSGSVKRRNSFLTALRAQTQTKENFESVAKQRFQNFLVVRLIDNCCNLDINSKRGLPRSARQPSFGVVDGSYRFIGEH
ncbi:hypothetical protein Pse7429DRAFT_0986 [Pseudanabaena biceps PCC 7429]|uniref:Uncharacterized protein n=1 Tax=Pseudanabaena biceps PCC 7429 TaxID=927668 RepID=L8N5D9_9CYAN|nr:hypothetical protein Pse7429DRAFT_0986 [Pseudanabaena biceps PCC 7429]